MSRIQEELQSVVGWITEQRHGLPVRADRRTRLSFGCLDLAVEHLAAIALLADKALWGPAYALLRHLLDAFVRGVWIARCASESDLDSFQLAGLRERSFETLVGDVERALGHSRGVLSKLRQSSWAMFSDCTQCAAGPAQGYPEAETDQALRVATALGLLAATERAALAGRREVVTACKERTRRFAELH